MQPGNVPNVAAARALAEEMRGNLKRLMQEGPKLQERAKSLQITEKSKDGLISATVSARGELIRLDIDPRVYRRADARALADAITETIHRAGKKGQDEIVELFASVVPREQIEAHLSGDMDSVQEQMHKQMQGER